MGRAVQVCLVIHQFEQHIAESGHSADRRTVIFIGQRGQRMKCPENIGGPIDQNDMGIFINRGCSAHNAASARPSLQFQ